MEKQENFERLRVPESHTLQTRSHDKHARKVGKREVMSYSSTRYKDIYDITQSDNYTIHIIGNNTCTTMIYIYILNINKVSINQPFDQSFTF